MGYSGGWLFENNNEYSGCIRGKKFRYPVRKHQLPKNEFSPFVDCGRGVLFSFCTVVHLLILGRLNLQAEG
jgi:hypothetical protein